MLCFSTCLAFPAYTLDQISHRAHTKLLALVIKQQDKNLAADNQAIKDQQQLLQNQYPTDKHSSKVSRIRTTNKARPKPRPRPQKTHDVQQTCNFASMQAQLSELQKMFCQFSESVNANKNRVEPYICVSSSDSKQYIPTNHEKRFRRRNSLNKLLTQKH